MKILSDTSVVIELLGEGPEGQKLSALAGNMAADVTHLYSSVTRLELEIGDHELSRKMEPLLSVMRSVPLDDSLAKKAGRLLTKSFGKRRRQIPDAIIAASAIQEDAWLWTLNERDFRDIPGLRQFSFALPDPLRKQDFA